MEEERKRREAVERRRVEGGAAGRGCDDGGCSCDHPAGSWGVAGGLLRGLRWLEGVDDVEVEVEMERRPAWCCGE